MLSVVIGVDFRVYSWSIDGVVLELVWLVYFLLLWLLVYKGWIDLFDGCKGGMCTYASVLCRWMVHLCFVFFHFVLFCISGIVIIPTSACSVF